MAPPPAGAHAVLQRSSPPHGSTVNTAPREVVLTFTEPLHPQASAAQVVDASGRRVSEGTEVSSDERTMRVKLGGLSRGTYTVQWRVLSRLDGHLTAGALSFGVGVAAPTLPASQPGPPPWQVVVRGLGHLSALSLAGALGFGILVLPVAGAADHGAVVRWVALPAAVTLATTAVLEATARAAWLHAPGQNLWETAQTLLRTSTEGLSLLLRIGGAVLAAIAWRGGAWWAATLSGASALAGLVVQSHAWAAGPLAVLADWLHLAAASVWVGGLLGLSLSLRRCRNREEASRLAWAFSRWAGGSLVVVALTGAYSAFLHVPDWRSLWDTAYGRWLLGKLALVLVVVALGAINRYRVLPRLESARGTLGRLRLSVRLELSAALGVLLLAAGLGTSPPARAVRAAQESWVLRFAAAPNGTHLVLAVEPAQAGWNRFTLTVRDARGTPLSVDRALLRLRRLDQEGAPPTVLLEPQADGVHAAEGTYLAAPGFWEIEVVLRWRGKPDQVVWFPLRVNPFQPASDLEAFRLLRRAQEALGQLRTWRETEQITDGAGNVVVTRYTYQRPDRLAFEVLGGVRGILIGKERFIWTDRGWQRDTLPEAFAARGPAVYMQNPLRAALGREEPCPEENCQVVLWDSSDGLASFAAWVGVRTHRVYKLLMWAPAHAMTSVLEGFNAALRVVPPTTR